MKKNTIDYWIEILNDQLKDKVEKRLADTLSDIEFLESIYMTGGKLSHFSQQFKDAAYTERQALCQLSSACYSILRNKTITEKN